MACKKPYVPTVNPADCKANNTSTFYKVPAHVVVAPSSAPCREVTYYHERTIPEHSSHCPAPPVVVAPCPAPEVVVAPCPAPEVVVAPCPTAPVVVAPCPEQSECLSISYIILLVFFTFLITFFVFYCLIRKQNTKYCPTIKQECCPSKSRFPAEYDNYCFLRLYKSCFDCTNIFYPILFCVLVLMIILAVFLLIK